jgi:hypothetical protein
MRSFSSEERNGHRADRHAGGSWLCLTSNQSANQVRQQYVCCVNACDEARRSGSATHCSSPMCAGHRCVRCLWNQSSGCSAGEHAEWLCVQQLLM